MLLAESVPVASCVVVIVPVAIWLAVIVPDVILLAVMVPAAILVPVIEALAMRSAFNVPVEILPAFMFETVTTEALIDPLVILLALKLANAFVPRSFATQELPLQRYMRLSSSVSNQRSPAADAVGAEVWRNTLFLPSAVD